MLETETVYKELLSDLTNKDTSKKKREWIKLKYHHFCNLCGYEFNWGAISDQVNILKMRNEIDTLYHKS